MKTKRVISYFLLILFLTAGLNAAPYVTSVTPPNGPLAGGNVVTLTGYSFTGATNVDFGTRPATSFVVVNDNTINATVPIGVVGTVDVIVTAGSASIPNTTDYYTYQTSSWQGIVSETNPNQVGLFDTNTNTFTTTILLPAFSVTSDIATDGERIYTGNSLPPGVTVIDAATNTIMMTVPTTVGPGAFASAVNPPGTRFYVTNINTGFVTVMDTATNTVIANVFIAPSLGNLSVTPDNTMLYVGSFGSPLLYVMDMATNTVVNTIFVGLTPGMIAITPDSTTAFVPILGNSTVAVVDLATQTVVNIIALPPGGQPYGASILPNGKTLYVVNIASATVSIIDIATETVTGTIALTPGTNPFWIAATPDSKKLFVINEVNDFVTPIDVASNTVGVPFPDSGANLQDLVISPDPAPVAYFSFTPQVVGVPTTFDASASLSPIGTIVSYSWDFGDGTQVTTGSPLINHTYFSPGAFSVTLTVTNSAGTSTTKVFSSRFMSNNGGPTATRTQTVQSIPFTPENVTGFQKKCKYPSQTDVVNVLKWTERDDSETVHFYIYRDSLDNLIAIVPGTDRLEYFDHNRHKGVAYTYYIFAVSSSGVMSAPAVITIQPNQKK